MNDGDSPRPWFQYSLWSLFVLTAVVAVLCSIGACTDWGFSIALAMGVLTCFVDFVKLSSRKHPEAGIIIAVGRFLFRFLSGGRDDRPNSLPPGPYPYSLFSVFRVASTRVPAAD